MVPQLLCLTSDRIFTVSQFSIMTTISLVIGSSVDIYGSPIARFSLSIILYLLDHTRQLPLLSGQADPSPNYLLECSLSAHDAYEDIIKGLWDAVRRFPRFTFRFPIIYNL
jgi:hypothetical protein